MKRRLSALLCALTLALSLSGCWSGDVSDDSSGDFWEETPPVEADTSSTLTPITSFALPYLQGVTLDPITCPDGMQQTLGALLYEGLFVLDESFAPQNVLCSRYEHNDDCTSYTFYLRDGVSFSDGSSLTASDVLATLRRAQESDQIRGYEVGAVDYITKPFVIGALQRKIKAMFAMLEHHKPAKDIYDDGRLFLDFSEQTASLNGKPLTLSPMEYKMLNLFRKNPRQVLTRGQLLEKLWDIDERFVDEHTLTTSISRIRSKIESDGGAPYIKTVYGMGYQWTGGEAK